MTALATCDNCAINRWPFKDSGVSSEARQVTQAYQSDIEQSATSAEYGTHKKLIRAIDELCPIFIECQTENWDGYGAQPISESAYINAIELYLQLPRQYPKPDITPEPDGAIGFEWYLEPYRTLSFSVRGDNTIIFSALFGINNSDYGDKPLDENLHPRLHELLGILYDN